MPKGKQGFQKGHGRMPNRIYIKGLKRPEHSGEKHWNWKGGRFTRNYGYVLVYSPSHPHKNKRNQVLEHRLVMEQVLGRYLEPNEIVHHLNGIRDDNRPENLRLVVWGNNWHPHACPRCGFEFLVK